MEGKRINEEDLELLKNILGDVKAIPIDASSLMAAYQLGYLNGLEKKEESHVSVDLYRKTCKGLKIAPVETIDELIKELVSNEMATNKDKYK